VPADVQGKTGFELVSARAWSAKIRQRASSLCLGADDIALSDRELPIRFDRCLESENPPVRSAALGLTRQFAHHLGYILLTLKRGDPASRAARPDWDDTYWNAWQGIESVVLGGGLLSGNLGPYFISHLSAFCHKNRLYQPSMNDTAWCAAMPMIGAARTAPADSQSAVVFDFGGSYIKRGWAHYANGALAELQPMAQMSARVDGSPQDVFDFMFGMIVSTWNELGINGDSLARTIPVSVATYMRGGQPYDQQGESYSSIRRIAANGAAALSGAVSARLGVAINVRLLHDGTAAALVHAGRKNTAVIMLGTAMGIGFPSSADGLWRLSPGLSVLPIAQ
jgi:hypothetical protein